VVSQTPDEHTRAPAAAVHVPAVVGRGVPFASFVTHAPLPLVPRLHHWVAVLQSVSAWQAVPQAPLAESQTGPACAPLQSLLVAHFPQAPVVAQKGASALGQAPGKALPSSAAHAAQTSVVGLQTGVAPTHALPLVAVHCTHRLDPVSHAGVAPEQSPSLAHCSHLP
jgi:hypothetical protein